MDAAVHPGDGIAVLPVFLKDLLALRRDRGALFMSLVVPILVITVLASALHQNKSPKIPLPVVNEDQGPVARTFIELLSEHAGVVEVSRPNAVALVRDRNKAAAAIVLPRDMSTAYQHGRTVEVELLTDPARGKTLERVRTMLLLADKRAAALADPLAENRLSLREESLTTDHFAPNVFEQTVPGFSMMFVLLAVTFGTATGMHDERSLGTLPRLLIAPRSFTSLLAGKLLVRFVVGMVQLLVFLVFGHLVFGISLGTSPLALLVLVGAMVLPAVGLGMFAAGIAGSTEQVLPVGLAFVLGFSCLGGFWWPVWTTPLWMQKISSLVFTTWAMYGMNDLMLRGRGLDALSLTVSVLLAHGVWLIALGMAMFRARYSAR